MKDQQHHKKTWVVIVTYNAEKWIRNCINSIDESTIRSSIVIVDNNSSDNTVAIISKEYTGCALIKNSTNKGFGYANNMGIRFSLENGADYVVLLNQDAKLQARALEHLLYFSAKYPEYGILTPMTYSYDGLDLDAHLLNETFRYNLALASDIFFDRAAEVYDVTLRPAAIWLIKKEALLDAGLFDPLFFMYREDDDLWNRFIAKNWKVGFSPKAVAYHHTANSGGYTLQKRIWYAYGDMVMGLKNSNRTFSNCLFKYIRNYASKTISATAFLNRSELYVLQVSFFSVLFKINKISRSRNLCLKTRGAFITDIN
jgi:GT2 family glycosyltransferase